MLRVSRLVSSQILKCNYNIQMLCVSTRLAPLCTVGWTRQTRSFATEESASGSLDQLKELRNLSGAPLKECKKALAATKTIEEALGWLRAQGVNVAQKKATQTATNGFVACMTDKMNKTAALVEINCVTDFVEKNPLFQAAVHDIAHTVVRSSEVNKNTTLESLNSVKVIPLHKDESTNQTVSEALTDILSSIRENLVLRRFHQMKATPKGLIGCYVHSRTTPYLGMKGGLVHLETNTEISNLPEQSLKQLVTLAKNIAIHCVVNTPMAKYIEKEEIPAEELEKQKQVLLERLVTQNSSLKLEDAQEKVETSLTKYFGEKCLLEQSYCLEDDNQLTIAKLLDGAGESLKLNIKIKQFVVFNLGEASQ